MSWWGCGEQTAAGPGAAAGASQDHAPAARVGATTGSVDRVLKASEAELAERYRSIVADMHKRETKLAAVRLSTAVSSLRAIADQTSDAHLRANASMAAGSLHEEAGDLRSAIAFYRQARAAVPQEAPTHAMLALALAGNKQFEDAVRVQRVVVKLVPDDLEAWMYLGEMAMKAGNKKVGAEAYAQYERRRRGILEGLTLKRPSGSYLSAADARVQMAAALEVAVDNGTALALLYVLKSDPDPGVRGEVARVMGAQRLLGYRKLLEELVAHEDDPEVKRVMAWALGEISRDGVETRPGSVPEGVEVPTHFAPDTGEEGRSDGPGTDVVVPKTRATRLP